LNTQSLAKQDSTNQQQSASSQQISQSNDFGLSEEPAPEVEDPLQGMSEKDRFGLKGLLAILKGPYADQAALASGIDITSLGFDLNTSE
jgi:CCR4-NOT transcription complex subunit 2